MQRKHVTSEVQINMGTSATARSRITPESIRRRINGAKITDIDKEVLDVELNILITTAQLSVDQAAAWIAESIEIRESTMSQRAEMEREISAAFGSDFL